MKVTRVFLGLLTGAVILVMTVCSTYEEKTYSISAMDEACCQEFKNAVRMDTTWKDSVIQRIDTVVIVDTAYSIPNQLYTLTKIDSSEAPWVYTYDTLKVSSDLPRMFDSLNMEKFKTAKITMEKPALYLVLSTPYYYSYLDLTCSTSSPYLISFNDYVVVNFYKSTGEKIKLNQENITMETFAGCTSIKTRLEYTLDAGHYLVEIVRDDKTVKNKMLMIMKKNQ